MRDELLLKNSPGKHQRLVMINGMYHIKYNVRDILDKLERLQSFICIYIIFIKLFKIHIYVF